MIVIEEIKSYSINCTLSDLRIMDPDDIVEVFRDGIPTSTHVRRIVESITGRCFTHPTGEEIWIGITDASSEHLGIHFDSIESLRESNTKLMDDISRLLAPNTLSLD